MFSDLCRWPVSEGKTRSEALLAGFRSIQFDVAVLIQEKLMKTLFLHIPQMEEVVAIGYRKSERATYFEIVSERLLYLRRRDAQQRRLVFLDPDTGLCPETGGDDSHVMLDSLEVVLKSLSPRDTLLIYQHRQRVRDNVSDFTLRVRALAAFLKSLKMDREPRLIDSDGAVEAYFIQI